MEISKTNTEKSPDDLSLPNQFTIIINIIYWYFITYGKKNSEIQVTKYRMELNNQIIKNHPPSPVQHTWAKQFSI